MFKFNEKFQNDNETTMSLKYKINNAPSGSISVYNGINFKVNYDGSSVSIISLEADYFYTNTTDDGTYSEIYNIDLSEQRVILNVNDTEYLLPITELGVNDNSIFNNTTFNGYKIINIKLPSTLIKINKNALNIYTQISNTIILPESLIYIGEKAFGNYQMDEIIIPKNVGEIGINAFFDTGLKSIIFKGDVLPKINTYGEITSFSSLINCTGYFTKINCPKNDIGNNKLWYGLIINCDNELDVAEPLAPDVIQVNDNSIKVSVNRLLEVSSDLNTAIDTVVDSVAPGADYEVSQPYTDSLQVNINSTTERLTNFRRESFFQAKDVQYVVFVFNADNANTQQSQMNALGGLDFSALGQSTAGTSNFLLYSMIILIVSILAGVLFFILRK